MVHARITVSPAEWSSAHAARSARLTLSVPTTIASALRPGGRVALHVTLRGMPSELVVTGTVTSVQSGERSALEVLADPESARSIAALDGGAGVSTRFPDRSERHPARLPVAVSTSEERGAGLYMTTLDVSEGGCSLRWSGQAPAAGLPLKLRIGAGRASVEVGAEVRWASSTGRATVVGLRFTQAQRVVVRKLLDDLQRVRVRAHGA